MTDMLMVVEDLRERVAPLLAANVQRVEVATDGRVLLEGEEFALILGPREGRPRLSLLDIPADLPGIVPAALRSPNREADEREAEAREAAAKVHHAPDAVESTPPDKPKAAKKPRQPKGTQSEPQSPQSPVLPSGRHLGRHTPNAQGRCEKCDVALVLNDSGRWVALQEAKPKPAGSTRAALRGGSAAPLTVAGTVAPPATGMAVAPEDGRCERCNGLLTEREDEYGDLDIHCVNCGARPTRTPTLEESDPTAVSGKQRRREPSHGGAKL